MNKSRLPTPNHFDVPLSAKLFRLVTLKDGWDSYGGKAPTREALIAMESIQIVPTSEGGVQFEFSTSCNDYEINFYPDGHIAVEQQ